MRPPTEPARREASERTTVASRDATLIVNPHAGGGRAARVAREAAALLTSRGVGCRVLEPRDAEDAARAAREAFGRHELAVGVGGDGVLRVLAAEAVDRPGAVVGVLPAGRGNDFARFLGLPTDVRGAVDALVDGEDVLIDTGVVRDATGIDKAFLSIVSIGFDAEANRRANQAPAWLGRLVYVWGALGALASLRPVALRLRGATGERRTAVQLLAVANAGAYGGGMLMAPHASVGDGLLDVVEVSHPGRRADRCDWRDRVRLVRFLPSVFRGTHLRVPIVRTERTDVLTVESDAASGMLTAYADGDPIGVLPLRISVRPRSLRLRVPAARDLPPGVLQPATEAGA